LRLICRFKIISEITAAVLYLGCFEPVHVIVNIAHSSGKLFASSVQMRQTLRDSSPFPAGKQPDALLVFTRDRAQNRIGLGNKHEQITAQLAQRDLLAWMNLALRKFVKGCRLCWLI